MKKTALLLIAALMLMSGCKAKEETSSIVDAPRHTEAQSPVTDSGNGAEDASLLGEGEKLYSNGDIFLLIDIDESINTAGEKAGKLMVNGDKNDSYDISLDENGGYAFGTNAVPIEISAERVVIKSGNLAGEYVLANMPQG